jgi:DNA-binding ferritin-like protein
MPRRKDNPSGEVPSRRKPASTPDGRESQMIELADQLAERQLIEGTASAQVITHFLKLGSSRERMEQEKLALETKLVEAKTQQIADQQRSAEMFAEAIQAMRAYQGGVTPPDTSESFE